MKSFLVLLTFIAVPTLSHAEPGTYAKMICVVNGSQGQTDGILSDKIEPIIAGDGVYYEFKYQPINYAWTTIQNPKCGFEFFDRGTIRTEEFNAIRIEKDVQTVTILCGLGSSYSTFASKDDYIKHLRKTKARNYTIGTKIVRQSDRHVSADECIIDGLDS